MEMEKELRDVATELSLPLKEGRGAEGQSLAPASSHWTGLVRSVSFSVLNKFVLNVAFLRAPVWNHPFSHYLSLLFL